MILTDHLAKCEGNGIDYNTPWYKWVIERLQQIFLLVSIYGLLSLIFTNRMEQLNNNAMKSETLSKCRKEML